MPVPTTQQSHVNTRRSSKLPDILTAGLRRNRTSSLPPKAGEPDSKTSIAKEKRDESLDSSVTNGSTTSGQSLSVPLCSLLPFPLSIPLRYIMISLALRRRSVAFSVNFQASLAFRPRSHLLSDQLTGQHWMMMMYAQLARFNHIMHPLLSTSSTHLPAITGHSCSSDSPT